MNNIFDILILIIFLVAIYNGGRNGIIKQLCGLAGILLGVWAASKFSDQVGVWIGYESLPPAVCFIVVFLVVVVVLLLIASLTRKIVHVAGLGVVDRIGGALLGLAKYTLVLSLALNLLVVVNNSLKLIDDAKLKQSRLIEPVRSVSNMVFPYLHDLKDFVQEKITIDND
ncbi:MAG: CvpA family protein [Tidjanibacter sp.]|nr:CvpA family protein [Tidjanibacter sp.]